jgi:hypothetical protein
MLQTRGQATLPDLFFPSARKKEQVRKGGLPPLFVELFPVLR